MSMFFEVYLKQLYQQIKSLKEVCQSGLQTDNESKSDQSERVHDIERLVQITVHFIITLTVESSNECISKGESLTSSRGEKKIYS